MSRHAPVCPSRPSALSIYIRTGLLGLSGLAMVASGGLAWAGTPPVLNPIPAQSGDQNRAYSLSLASFAAATDRDPITYTLTGALPAGLSLSDRGQIIGTPTASGVFNLSATASDKDGSSAPRDFTLTITPGTPPILRVIPAQNSLEKRAYVLSLAGFATATEGDTITYTLTGSLPAGLSFNTRGQITGAPTASGIFNLTAKATDKDGGTEQPFTLTITPGTPPILGPIPPQNGIINKAFSYGLGTTAAATERDPITYTLTGDLPAGSTYNASRGVIGGVPTVTGAFPLKATACDIDGCVEQTFTLTISLPTATGKLNDSGVLTCGSASANSNILACDDPAVATPAQQDGANGRDYAAQQGTLTKIGASTPNDGKANGFDFIKIGSNGQPLAIQNGTWSVSGTETDGTKWDCVLDNVTGLLWEIKSGDNGLRDLAWTYSWFSSDSATNGGGLGTANGGNCFPSGSCDTEKYVAEVNAAGLCGYNNWRMPKSSELEGIVDLGRLAPTIDAGYFPSSQAAKYWSALPLTDDVLKAWYVNFNIGSAVFDNKSKVYAVRLVRNQ